MPREVNPGYVRGEFEILPVSAVTGIGDGAGALTLVDTRIFGFVFTVEKLVFVSGSVATGAGATQIYKLRHGGPTGDVIATLTLNLADVAGVGLSKAASVAATDDPKARIVDAGAAALTGLSLTRDAGGTTFTKLEGVFNVIVRQKPQAR